jgi:hypothetical protein
LGAISARLPPALDGRRLVLLGIDATTTRPGLIVRCALDTRDYPKGVKLSDDEMDALNIAGDAFRPEWDDTISP